MFGYKKRFLSRGFTLVELLVVIAIIALLLSILMPSLKKARDQAQEMICMSHLKTIGNSGLLYTMDNSDYFPTSHSPDDLSNDRYNCTRYYPDSSYKSPWYLYLYPYHENFEIYRCPGYPKMVAYEVHGSGIWTSWYLGYPALDNFTYRDGYNYLRSGYGYNNFVGGWHLGAKGYEPKRVTEVPSYVGLFGDSWLRNSGYDRYGLFGRTFGATHMMWNGAWLTTGDVRHSNFRKAVVAYVDGHIKKEPKEKVLNEFDVAGRFRDTVWYIK